MYEGLQEGGGEREKPWLGHVGAMLELILARRSSFRFLSGVLLEICDDEIYDEEQDAYDSDTDNVDDGEP